MTDPIPVPRIEAIEITRQGENGGLRIAIPLSMVTTLPSGRQFVEPAATIAFNVAELMHDPEFAACVEAVKKQADRLVSGELKPQPPVLPDDPASDP